jgi:hypothetical protein
VQQLGVFAAMRDGDIGRALPLFGRPSFGQDFDLALSGGVDAELDEEVEAEDEKRKAKDKEDGEEEEEGEAMDEAKH